MALKTPRVAAGVMGCREPGHPGPSGVALGSVTGLWAEGLDTGASGTHGVPVEWDTQWALGERELGGLSWCLSNHDVVPRVWS